MKSENKMLEGYFGIPDSGFTTEQWQRYLAVQAALEIAKATVGASFNGSFSKAATELDAVAERIEPMADSIQAAISKY